MMMLIAEAYYDKSMKSKKETFEILLFSIQNVYKKIGLQSYKID